MNTSTAHNMSPTSSLARQLAAGLILPCLVAIFIHGF